MIGLSEGDICYRDGQVQNLVTRPETLNSNLGYSRALQIIRSQTQQQHQIPPPNRPDYFSPIYNYHLKYTRYQTNPIPEDRISGASIPPLSGELWDWNQTSPDTRLVNPISSIVADNTIPYYLSSGVSRDTLHLRYYPEISAISSSYLLLSNSGGKNYPTVRQGYQNPNLTTRKLELRENQSLELYRKSWSLKFWIKFENLAQTNQLGILSKGYVGYPNSPNNMRLYYESIDGEHNLILEGHKHPHLVWYYVDFSSGSPLFYSVVIDPNKTITSVANDMSHRFGIDRFTIQSDDSNHIITITVNSPTIRILAHSPAFQQLEDYHIDSAISQQVTLYFGANYFSTELGVTSVNPRLVLSHRLEESRWYLVSVASENTEVVLQLNYQTIVGGEYKTNTIAQTSTTFLEGVDWNIGENDAQWTFHRLDTNPEANNWSSFGSRNTKNTNQPYKHITIKSIIDKCDKKFPYN